MTKKVSDHTQDNLDFSKEIDGIAPFEQDKVKSWKQRPPPIPLEHKIIDDTKPAYDRHYLSQVQTGDELNYCHSGLQKRIFQDLRRGKMSIDMHLDLHGMHAKMAQQALETFFHESHHFHCKCLLIIHGKGFGSHNKQPVLKRLVDTWLRDRKDVLAFCSATTRDGGTGAAYVLLRSHKTKIARYKPSP